MNFKNGKRKIGLIALLSCVLTATVAFAAYTGYNYINGTVTVEGSPFKMVFANADGGDIIDNTIKGPTEPGDLLSDVPSSGLYGGATAGDITVTEDGTKIESFNVKLTSELDESGNVVGATYVFSVRNDGGAPAYLSGLTAEALELPYAGDGSLTSGLGVRVALVAPDGSSPLGALQLWDGDAPQATLFPAGPAVGPGEFVLVSLMVVAQEPVSGSPVWAAVGKDGNYGAEITIPEITIEWSAVPPAASGT